jgi:hypothetical protein
MMSETTSETRPQKASTPSKEKTDTAGPASRVVTDVAPCSVCLRATNGAGCDGKAAFGSTLRRHANHLQVIEEAGA